MRVKANHTVVLNHLEAILNVRMNCECKSGRPRSQAYRNRRTFSDFLQSRRCLAPVSIRGLDGTHLFWQPAFGSRGASMNATILSLCLATQPAVPSDGVWRAWSFAPQVVLPLIGASLLYGHGWWAGRATAEDRDTHDTRACFFLAGTLALAVAVVSPLCRLAAELAWAHMVQHVLLVAVAPPLILLACPLDVVARDLPGLSQRAKWLRSQFPQAVVSVICSTVVYGVSIWFWHIPATYQGALLSEAVHLVLYATLLGASFWFWNAVLHGIRARGEQLGVGVAALFLTLLHTGLLAVLLTLSPRPWYPLMSQNSAAWGLSPLEDQQLAGLIMWVPMSFIYLGAALALAARWIGGTEGAAERKA